MEEIALVISPSACLCEADIEQHTAIETARRSLNTISPEQNCYYVGHQSRDVNERTSEQMN